MSKEGIVFDPLVSLSVLAVFWLLSGEQQVCALRVLPGRRRH